MILAFTEILKETQKIKNIYLSTKTRENAKQINKVIIAKQN